MSLNWFFTTFWWFFMINLVVVRLGIMSLTKLIFSSIDPLEVVSVDNQILFSKDLYF